MSLAPQYFIAVKHSRHQHTQSIQRLNIGCKSDFFQNHISNQYEKYDKKIYILIVLTHEIQPSVICFLVCYLLYYLDSSVGLQFLLHFKTFSIKSITHTQQIYVVRLNLCKLRVEENILFSSFIEIQLTYTIFFTSIVLQQIQEKIN